ncbi:lycopene cyclase domain-containing protein [Brevibacterium album]|uniref:lycopene cyclase domain-containing protein n=1 Tax=Brevibacterium album TaxID=417948 RepID=UPI0003FCCC39|nr:lycopene cyclase domain-containing protein [Brevibacterium album]
MTYWIINAGFLAAAAALFALALRADRRRPRARLSRTASLITALVLLTLTAVFDNIMIAVGLVAYGDAQISGIRLGLMPVEDFSYTVFAVLALPALWVLLDGRRPRAGARPGTQPDEPRPGTTPPEPEPEPEAEPEADAPPRPGHPQLEHPQSGPPRDER